MKSDGYRDELAVAHERIAQLEEQVRELLHANDAPEQPSRLVTLRRERSATIAQQAVLNSGWQPFAVWALAAAVTAAFAAAVSATVLGVTAVFAFLSARAFLLRRRELRAQRALVETLDDEIMDAEQGELSSAHARVRLAERADGEDQADYADRLRLLR